MILSKRVIECSGRADRFTLIPIGDIHLGTKNCDEKKLLGFIRYIADTPNTFWCGMGDYAECINYSDKKRFDPCNLHPRFKVGDLGDLVKKQFSVLTQMFQPIKEKCIFILSGNHEETIRLKYHHEAATTFALNMSAPHLGYNGMFRLTFRRQSAAQSVIIFAHHGWGGARRVGSSKNKIDDCIRKYEADIYLLGHDHQLDGSTKQHLRMSKSGEERLFEDKKILGLTGSYYKTYQQGTTSYGEKAGYDPTVTGSLKITIEPFRKKSINGKSIDMPPHLHISQ